jgi:hypothetical protein
MTKYTFIGYKKNIPEAFSNLIIQILKSNNELRLLLHSCTYSYIFVLQYNPRIVSLSSEMVLTSVGDPDLEPFGPPGSGSISQTEVRTRLRIRIFPFSYKRVEPVGKL